MILSGSADGIRMHALIVCVHLASHSLLDILWALPVRVFVIIRGKLIHCFLLGLWLLSSVCRHNDTILLRQHGRYWRIGYDLFSRMLVLSHDASLDTLAVRILRWDHALLAQRRLIRREIFNLLPLWLCWLILRIKHDIYGMILLLWLLLLLLRLLLQLTALRGQIVLDFNDLL